MLVQVVPADVLLGEIQAFFEREEDLVAPARLRHKPSLSRPFAVHEIRKQRNLVRNQVFFDVVHGRKLRGGVEGVDGVPAGRAAAVRTGSSAGDPLQLHLVRIVWPEKGTAGCKCLPRWEKLAAGEDPDVVLAVLTRVLPPVECQEQFFGGCLVPATGPAAAVELLRGEAAPGVQLHALGDGDLLQFGWGGHREPSEARPGCAVPSRHFVHPLEKPT